MCSLLLQICVLFFHPAKQNELDYVYKVVPDHVRKAIENAQPSCGPSTDFASAVQFVSKFIENRTIGNLDEIFATMKKVYQLGS